MSLSQPRVSECALFLRIKSCDNKQKKIFFEQGRMICRRWHGSCYLYGKCMLHQRSEQVERNHEIYKESEYQVFHVVDPHHLVDRELKCLTLEQRQSSRPWPPRH